MTNSETRALRAFRLRERVRSKRHRGIRALEGAARATERSEVSRTVFLWFESRRARFLLEQVAEFHLRDDS